MKRAFNLGLCLFFAIPLLTACGAGGQSSGGDSTSADSQEAATATARSGPLSAVATSAISVNLAWDPVDGATGYRIENQFGDSEWFTIAELDGNQTTFEDFLVPENQELNYRLTPLLAGEDGKALTTKVATPASVPNPYTVVATLEEPDYGSVGLDIPGFDPSTFDPSTFDPSALDLSGLNADNLDLSSLQPEPVSVIATLGPEGGSLSVTGSNGVVYTLNVPPGALLFETPIVMTPVKEIQGYPFSGGYFGAVEIRPQGINFAIPAMLTIELPVAGIAATGADPDLVQVAFAFQGSGQEFHLTPREIGQGVAGLSPSSGTAKLAMPSMQWRMINIPVRQTNSVGAGNATRGEARRQAADHPTTSESSKTDQKAAASQIEDELAPLDPVSKEQQKAADQAFYRSYSEVQAALRDASNARELDAALYRFEKELYDKRRFDTYLQDVDRQLLWDTAVAAVFRNLDLVDCPSDEAAAIQKLARRLQHPGTDFEKELAQRFMQKYGDDGKRQLEKIEALQSCRVKLIVKSTAVYSDEICKVDIKVDSEIPLFWNYDGGGYLQGAAALKYSNANNLPVSDGFNSTYTRCKEVKIQDLSTAMFEVIKLVPKFSGGVVFDWNLASWTSPGQATQICRTLVHTDESPPRTETVCVPLPGGVEKDLWGGLVKLVELKSGVAIGANNWKLDFDPESPDQAKWEYPQAPVRASGEGWRHQHTTTLTLTAE
jgi:hypothetical protein